MKKAQSRALHILVAIGVIFMLLLVEAIAVKFFGTEKETKLQTITAKIDRWLLIPAIENYPQLEERGIRGTKQRFITRLNYAEICVSIGNTIECGPIHKSIIGKLFKAPEDTIWYETKYDLSENNLPTDPKIRYQIYSRE